MDISDPNNTELDTTPHDSTPQVLSSEDPSKTNGNSSQNLFPESPIYEPDELDSFPNKDVIVIQSSEDIDLTKCSESQDNKKISQVKRKLSDESVDINPKIQKLDNDLTLSTQTLDEEVSSINAEYKVEEVLPSSSRVLTPKHSNRRKISKRSNSTEIPRSRTPKTPKTRPVSVDTSREHEHHLNISIEQLKSKLIQPIPEEIVEFDSSSSRPSVEFVKEIPPPSMSESETISKLEDKSSEFNDSQDFHLVLSPTNDGDIDDTKIQEHTSESTVVTNKEDICNPDKLPKLHSEGFNYSDQSSKLSQPKHESKGKTTDQESTDSVSSMSPDNMPTVTSKLIKKLSNGNSSTPTENSIENKLRSTDDSENTPDMTQINRIKGKKGKNESFRSSNTTTPSTISPLPNGHSLPGNTPQIPVFDFHISTNEDGEFLSLYIVRTDNDLGMDMCKEYQRFSKRFTSDPYLADVSVSNSPSSVTSVGMINLPNRTSFASTVSSTSTSSNRTSDGAFVVPQAPRKSFSNPSSTVKGYDALMKKLNELFSHVREFSMEENNRSSSDDKVSVGVQVLPISDSKSMSNGNASPEEVSKCDKATPKSSLKKTRMKGRRHLAGKTKRAILPTQAEEPELFLQSMNSPEMVPMNGDGDKFSIKSPKDEQPLSSLVGTPKSVTKLKQKRRPTSPRPATPVEKALVKQEYPGYPPETAVLARWVDKRYYSGKVLEITEPNKYLIKFDDGQSKVLIDDFIIFGDMNKLPLQGQSVYAMVDEEQNFEPGLVLSVEENSSGTVIYRCTTDADTVVMVTASELYLTEDQARSLKDSARIPSSPSTNTPRRRHHRELDLDNIIQGPRSARSRDKGNSSAKKRVLSPKSPKASTSGVRSKIATNTPTSASRKRVASESSEMSESSNSAPPVRIEEVAGVEPEVQKTPRKIDGVKAGPLQLKGATKQNIGKKNSKLTKFCNDEATVSALGPIPSGDNSIFAGLCFLLTCAETPKRSHKDKNSSHYSSEEDGETTSTMAGTDTEDLEFTDRPFNKERLKEQLEAGGGIVYSHFDDVPKNKYGVCKLIAPRPCLTAKYIQCVAADVRAVSHAWVVSSCSAGTRLDIAAYQLPAGWSILNHRFITWVPPSGKRTMFFKDKIILLCGDQDMFVKFWERVCTLVGATTRVVNEEDLNMSGALVLVTEWDCPHEVQNKANEDNIPLVSTTWIVQCLIEARVIAPTSHDKFSFMYTEPE